MEQIEHIEDVRPDRSFMRQLKMINKKLGCKFNGKHFVITYQTDRYGEVNIWKVVDERGNFRQPDHRELDIIRASNMENRTVREHFNLAEAYMENFRQGVAIRDKKEMRDHIREDRRVLRKRFSPLIGGAGKDNATFRRIDLKPKQKGLIIVPGRAE